MEIDNSEDEKTQKMLSDIQNLTSAERLQLKRALRAYMRRPDVCLALWLDDRIRLLKKQVLLSNLIMVALPRLGRLHRLNQLALCQSLRCARGSKEEGRWIRFSNRLGRLSDGLDPWQDG